MVVSRIVRALHPVEFVFYCAFSLKVERSAVRVRQPWPEREVTGFASLSGGLVCFGLFCMFKTSIRKVQPFEALRRGSRYL